MRKITAIEPQKDRNRVNIHLDGEFVFGLDRIVAAWLRTGQELSEDRIAQLQADDLRERAYQQAMLFLSYRARSEQELRRNLARHKVPEPLINETLNKLRQAGLANDDRFAGEWVENRSTFRPRSRRALLLELRRKGIDEETACTAVAGVDEPGLAREAARRQAARYRGLEWNEFRTKLSGYLARRGFSYAVLVPVVTQIWNEMHAEEPHYEDEEQP